MNEILENIDIMELLTGLWTAILLPVLTYFAKQVHEWLEAKKLDKYAHIFYAEILNAVKCIYETEVKDIKGTSDWTIEKQQSIRELAKVKAIQALSTSVYKCLVASNEDFEDWLDSLIDTALYDIKHPKISNLNTNLNTNLNNRKENTHGN